MNEPKPWVKALVEETFKPALSVGLITKHPDGRTVKILDGRFWGEHGVSNFWYWAEVLADGSLGPEENGYGW